MSEIKPASENESRKILPLIQEYFSYTQIDEKELAWRIHSPKHFYHCVHEKSQFAGYAEWEIIDAEKKIIRLNGIAVLPEFRGRGCAHALLHEGECVAREKGMKKMTLLVAEKNNAAKELYAHNKWVFARKHLRKINGENTEVWEKTL